MAEAGLVTPTTWGEREIKGPVHLFRERLLLRAFAQLVPTGRVLDAGCGSGSLAIELCRLGYEVEAVEQSEEFVNMVGGKIASYGPEIPLSVQCASVTELPFDDDSFDGLVCGEVLEHINPELGGDLAAVAEFHRVLKPGKACVVSVPLNPKLWDASDEWAGHVKRYTKEGLISLFVEHGFTVKSTNTWGFPLGRLYHRLLFGPWLRKISTVPASAIGGRADTKAANNRTLVGAVAGLFRFDELFSRSPWGRGIVLSAVKTS